MTGLPATGKSTVARLISRALANAQVLSTDEIREDYFPAEIYGRMFKYSSGSSRVIYDLIFYRSRSILLQNKSLVIDGTNLRNNRDSMIEICSGTGALPVFVKSTCDESIVRGRFEKRVMRADYMSEAKYDTYERMKSLLASDPEQYLDSEHDRYILDNYLLIVINTGSNWMYAYNADKAPKFLKLMPSVFTGWHLVSERPREETTLSPAADSGDADDVLFPSSASGMKQR